MSTLGEEFEAFLYGKAAVAALIATRIRPEVLEELETLPAVTYTVIYAEHENHLKGAVGNRHTRLQVDCYAETSAGASQVAKVIREAMAGYRGSWGEVFINGVTLDRSLSAVDPPNDGSSDWRYVQILEFLISHTESVLG